MSAPPKFATLDDAIAAYRDGRSRRWADVDGWQIDLEQAKNEMGRVREEPAAIKPQPLYDRALVAKNIAAELARASEVLPELAVPSEAARDVECCRECGRPMIGGGGAMRSETVHSVTFYNTEGRSWVATIGPFIVEVRPRTADDKAQPDDSGHDWEWSVLVQAPKGYRLIQLCKSKHRNVFGTLNGTERERYDAMSMAAIAIRDELTIAMAELNVCRNEELEMSPITNVDTLIKAMIDARSRLAARETLPIDAGWCLHERQYRMLAGVGATISDSKGETFRGEPITVRAFGGYVFDRATGSRMSIEGEQ